MKPNTRRKKYHMHPLSRALLPAAKVKAVLILALCFLAQVYHAARADATEITGSSTEQEIRLFRASHQIPQEEEQLTNQELFEKMRQGHGTWPTFALQLRVARASAEEAAALADEFIAFVNGLDPASSPALLAVKARRAFPDKTAVRVLAETLLHSKNIIDVELMVGRLGPVGRLNAEAHAEAAAVLLEVHRRITEDRDSFDVDLEQYGDHLYRLFWDVVAALGNCGDPGLDVLLQLPYTGHQELWQTEGGLRALGRIGTERAVALIFEELNRRQSSDSQLDCLEGLVPLPDLKDAPGLREFLRAELPQYFADAKSSVRLHAVRIAKKTRDPAFLPALEDLAANDPHVAVQESGYTAPVEYFPVRKAAQNAIEFIKKANNFYSRRELLEMELRDLEKKLAKYQTEQEIPALSTHRARYVEGTQKEIDEVKEELEALEQE